MTTHDGHQAFEGVETPQENCRTTRDDLAPYEGFGLTSGPVRKKASNQNRLF